MRFQLYLNGDPTTSLLAVGIGPCGGRDRILADDSPVKPLKGGDNKLF
jgi:hypothetical protein